MQIETVHDIVPFLFIFRYLFNFHGVVTCSSDRGVEEKYGASDTWLSVGGHRHWCEIQTYIGSVFMNIAYTQLAIISIDRLQQILIHKVIRYIHNYVNNRPRILYRVDR